MESVTLPPPPVDQLPPAPTEQRPRPIANLWHTAVLIVVLLAFSYFGSNGGQGHATAKHGKTTLYASTIAFEWIIVGYIILGTRRRGVGLRNLIGDNSAIDRLFTRGLPEWSDMKPGTKRFVAAAVDFVLALAFWFIALAVLAGLAKLLGLYDPGKMAKFQKDIGFLAPKSGRDLLWFMGLSASAGFCEEVIFRGYFQRQFAAISGSAVVGIIVQAVLFGSGHGYEGVPRMIMIAVFGAMFGVMTYFRKSLRPGMLAHFFHDGSAGLVLYLVAKGLVPMPK